MAAETDPIQQLNVVASCLDSHGLTGSAAIVREAASRLLAAQTREQALREALRKLANEARGFLGAADRETHGLTNMRVLERRIHDATAVLAVPPPAGDP